MKYFELVYDQSSATFAQRKHRKRPCGTANHMQKSGHEVTEAVDVEEFATHLDGSEPELARSAILAIEPAHDRAITLLQSSMLRLLEFNECG